MESDVGIDPEKVLKWLREGGYPLEYETARQLRGAGLAVEQGRHYTDPITAKSREVDVFARVPDRVEPDVRVCLAVECKARRDRPWVVLTTDEAVPGTWTPIATTDLATELAAHPAELREALPLSRPYGFGVIEAKPGKEREADEAAAAKADEPGRRDRAHDALEQAVSAAVGMALGEEPARGPLAAYGDQVIVSTFGPATLVVPVVVTEAQLFRLAVLEPGKEDLNPIQWHRIRWHGAQAYHAPTIVDVVTRPFLPEYAVHIRAQLGRAANAAAQARAGA